MSQNPVFSFHKAERKQCKASILIEGLTGSGKSGLALVFGKALAGDYKKVFAIDTENGSLPLFSGLNSSSGGKFEDFQIGNFTPNIGYKPSHYLAFRDEAVKAGATVVIMDSISHAWQYKGGILDILNDVKATSRNSNEYAAWGDPRVAKEKGLLFELLRDNRVHCITTVRVKEKMEIGTNEQGKTTVQSLGEQQIMQADIKYEPDLVLHMITAGTPTTPPVAKVVKSRYAMFVKGETYHFTPELCEQLRKYLEDGTSPEEIEAAQHKEYEDAVKGYLTENANKKTLWKLILTELGYKDAKVKDLPLSTLKQAYIKLTVD